MGPFDRFNDRAKRVLALAQDEAIRFNHNYIGVEHLLLGLVREGEGAAARTLDSLGVELSKVRKAVEFTIGRGDAATPPSDITLTPRVKKVIELAIDEAKKLGQSHVGTEHLLLGIVRDGESVATGVLESLGLSLDKVRHQVVAVLGQTAARSGLAHQDDWSPPAELLEVQNELIRIRSEKEAAMEAQQYELASGLRQQERELQQRLLVAGADTHFALDSQGKRRDWYCEDVLSGKLTVEVLHDSELVLGFRHPMPMYQIHGVVIPKKHVSSLMATEALDGALLAAMLTGVQEVARALRLENQGFRLEANAGAPGVTPHMHWHVVGPGLPPARL